MKEMDRRQFIKTSGAATAAIVAASLGVPFIIDNINKDDDSGSSRKNDKRKPKWIMVVDLSKCNGCGSCTKACQDEHYLPMGHEWIKIYEAENALGGKYHLPRPCMHCENAPCVNVCPVRATYHNEDDVVVVDNTKCIGCRLCMAACPYQARYFNWTEPDNNPPPDKTHLHRPEFSIVHKKGTVGKCMFCVHRADEGRLPACVEGCPSGALYFGDLIEDAVTNSKGETLKVSEDLKRKHAFKLKEDLGTEPSVYYLPAGNLPVD